MQTIVKTYTTDEAYRRDAKRMSAKGWRVVSVVHEKPRAGCGRIGCLGLFALVFPPKPVLVVTYEKEQ